MKKILARFIRNRRGAIALIFAGSLLPLVMLIGLSIDYSFYAQARSQFSLAGDAAATYAIREATATYTLDTTAGESNTAAVSDAETSGNTAGAAWFTTQLATLPTATISGTTPTVNVQATGQSSSSTAPSGFTATVGYVGIYPPFFDPLFGSKGKWDIIGTSGATSQYAYVEILMLLDTSGSMLVSADQSDVQTMNDNTVCIPNGEFSDGDHISTIGAYADPDSLVVWDNVVNKVTGTSGLTVQCQTGMNEPGQPTTTTKTTTTHGKTTTTIIPTPAGTPYAPCAFACHTTSTQVTFNGVTAYGDLYGMARRLGVKLKTDVVFSSTESAIQTMISSEQVSNQFTLGIYQFNDDVCPMVVGSGSDLLPEATGNLNGALATINGDDFNITPTETNFPPISPNEDNDFTDFPVAVSDLIVGKFGCDGTTASTIGKINLTTGTPLATPSATILAGSIPTNPQKDIFIITDGMEDSGTNSTAGTISNSRSTACGRVLGEMTGVGVEAVPSLASTTNCDEAVCEPLKKLGFTVYVLDITYPAVENNFYYDVNPTSDQYIADDVANRSTSLFGISGLTSASGGTAQVWNEGVAGVTDPADTLTTPSPNQQALEACASTQSDFFLASDSNSITTAMSLMLKSALSSAIRIVQ